MKADLNNTLEQLDKKIWSEPDYNSLVVNTCHQLRKKPLRNFTIEDLRIMIGQNINLEFLIPIAIEQLKKNILAKGDFYEGDLLKNVLDCDSIFWASNRELWSTVKKLYSDSKQTFESGSTFKQIRKSFEHFEKI